MLDVACQLLCSEGGDARFSIMEKMIALGS